MTFSNREMMIQAAINTVLEGKSAPQLKSIVKHLAKKRGARLSTYEAIMLYRIHALPKRITEIEQYGISVKKDWAQDDTGRNYRTYEIDWT